MKRWPGRRVGLICALFLLVAVLPGMSVAALGAAPSTSAANLALQPSIGGGPAAPLRARFETPSVVDPIHTNGEPDIALDPQGRVFVSGPTGTGTQRSTWFGSLDGGHTYRVMAQKVPPKSIQSIPGPGPGGGDTDINFDRTGKQYFADLYGLACLRVATTGPTNSGASDQEGFLGCGPHSPGADRQWLAVYDPAPGSPNSSAYRAAGGQTPLVYLAYNNLNGPGPNAGEQWNKSTDGLTYSNATADVTVATEASYSPFGGDGYPAIDQVSGKVFQAAGCDSNRCGGASPPGTPGLYLNIGTPDATGTLHFLDDAAPNQDLTKLIKIADTPTGPPDTLFSVLSMDTARNIFAVWAVSSNTPGDRQVFVSAASAKSGWTTWSPPVQVSDASTSTGDAVNVFPWIRAGGRGLADAVWYGSNKDVDPSSHNNQVWNVFMSQLAFPTDRTGAVTGSAPPVGPTRVTPHPMHYDDICLSGTGCILSTGNRNLADFFEINVDKTGAAVIVYDDTSNGLVQAPNSCANQVLDHCGAGVISVARQTGGTGLYGKPISGLSNAPVLELDDPSGDGLYPVIGGTNQPGMDVRESRLSLDLAHGLLSVITKVGDLTNPADTITKLTQAGDAGVSNLQYLTRWQMGNTIYYAAMENTAANQPIFYAGKAQSIDLCSVSACFPHVITYPEPNFGGSAESGAIVCPASPSPQHPCTMTISVKLSDIGNPGARSLLEEVGAYSLSASIQEGAETNASAQNDTVPVEIDGVCCYNFR